MKKQLWIAAFVAAATVASHASLVAHYTFDTDGADSGTSGGVAALGDAASITATSKVGAGALDLAGSPGTDTAGADGAVSANSFTWTTDTRTVAFWMKAASGDAGDANATMISLGSGTGGGNRFDVRLNGDNLRLEVQGGGQNTSVALADGSWHHVAIVVTDGATVATTQYSIDGGTLTAFGGSGTAIATGIGPLRMGDSYQDDGRDFKGSLDDVRLYDTVLSQAEITALAAIPEPATLGLVALFGGGVLFIRRRLSI